MMWDFGRLPFTYGGGGALEEHGSECYDVVDLPPMRKIPSLNTAGSDEGGDEDIYTTRPTTIPEL